MIFQNFKIYFELPLQYIYALVYALIQSDLYVHVRRS